MYTIPFVQTLKIRQIKIFTFILICEAGDILDRDAEVLAEFLDAGWRIVASGGAGGDGGIGVHPWAYGFLVLERFVDPLQNGTPPTAEYSDDDEDIYVADDVSPLA